MCIEQTKLERVTLSMWLELVPTRGGPKLVVVATFASTFEIYTDPPLRNT